MKLHHLAAAACLAVSAHVSATTFGLNLVSVHVPQSFGMNDRNPGVYMLTDGGILLDVYYNTWRKTSVALAYDWHVGPFDVMAGVVTGYQRGKRMVPCADYSPTQTRCWIDTGWSRGALAPVVIPSLRLPAVAGVTPRITVMPGIHAATVIHLSIERDFK